MAKDEVRNSIYVSQAKPKLILIQFDLLTAAFSWN
jgi:hypothetical protein